MNTIPESHRDLLEDKKRAFVYLATLMPNGTPQVTPVWFDTDGTHILINTAVGRVKDYNMHARPPVALCIADPDNLYRYVQIRGRVVASTRVGAVEHINTLSQKYRGHPYDLAPGQVRIIYKILPERVDAHG
jgi:PPOX class probable F420-dependent enzyme